ASASRIEGDSRYRRLASGDAPARLGVYDELDDDGDDHDHDDGDPDEHVHASPAGFLLAAQTQSSDIVGHAGPRRTNLPRGIRISSPTRRSGLAREDGPDPRLGREADRVRDLLLRQGDARGADVDRDAVALLFPSEDFVVRNRNHLPALLILEEESHGARHRAQFYEEETRILEVSLPRARGEQQPCLVSVHMPLDRTQEGYAVAIVMHRGLRRHVRLPDH